MITSFFSFLIAMPGVGRMVRRAGVWCLVAGACPGAEVWEREGYVLAPEVEARWQEWMDGARPLREKKERERMAGVIAGMRKAHGLGEGEVRVLEGVVPVVVAATVRDWERFLRRIHRPAFQGTAKEGLEAMAVFKQELVGMMAGHEIAFYWLPQEREEFVEAVRQVLPREVFERWEAERVRCGEERKRQAREWVEAGIRERRPTEVYAGELAKALDEGRMILGSQSEGVKALEKQVEAWSAAYEGVCREVSVLRADSFLLEGPGWREASQRGWFLFLPRRTGVMNAQRAELRRMAVEGGARVAGPEKAWEAEEFTLAPEVEMAWEAQMREERARQWKKREKDLEEEVERLRERHGLSEAGAARLLAAGRELRGVAMAAWEQSMRKLFRPGLKGEAGAALARMKERYGPGVLAGFPAPVAQETLNSEAWEKRVKRELSTEEHAAWRKERDERLKRRAEETRALVAAGRERGEPEKHLREALEREVFGQLPQEEGEAEWRVNMEAAAEDLGKRYAKECEEQSVAALEARDDQGATWQSARKSGGYFLMQPTEPWVEGHREELMGLLPEAVKAAHQKGNEERAARLRAAVVRGRAMVVELVTALDEGQRSEVEALAGRLPMEEEDPMTRPDEEPRPWRVWRTEEGWRGLAAILDDRQERLAAKGLARLEQGYSGSTPGRETQPVVLRHPARGPTEAGEVEAAVSAHLAEASQELAMRGLERLLKEVEVVARAAGLDEGQRAVLELAAKGTVQAAVEAHRLNQGRYLRSQLRGATPENVRERLRSIGGYSFQMGQEGETLVEEALEGMIDEAGRRKVESHLEAVRKRRQEAILAVALSRLETVLGLTAKQRAGLDERVAAVMEKHGRDIDETFRMWGERMPWHLQSYYLMLPCAGVAEEELKGLLNKRQMERWNEWVTERGGHYWSQVLEQQEMRQQNGGRGKEKRRLFFEP